ncbi:large ribosomal subunit protein bL17m isoform X3 [Ovis aries]|uniref:large ribosomal subunit protein bL17m isoform X3 n=1 Tax=Ovis aries TaxID=9940 RepID=UPI0029526D93|nr:large ribosomal subunit protein bL17m isoform X3 [Ovis aries]
MHLLTTLSSFMKLEASGDGKPLLKEPAGSAFLTAVVKELRSRLEISESKLPDSGKEPALLSCSSLWSKLKTGAWPQGGRSFRRWEVTSERKPTGSVFLTAVVAGIPQKKWSGHHGQQKSPKCSTWMQSQKRQNDLCSFPRQIIQYHSNSSLCPNQNH